MSERVYQFARELPHPPRRVFDWHARPGAFERLTPPWERVRCIHESGTIRDGDRKVLRLGGPVFGCRWDAVHRDFRDGEQFVDVQVRGPFRKWEHTHQFLPGDQPGTCRWVETVRYELPMAGVVPGFVYRMLERKLERMMRYRERILLSDLEEVRHWEGRPKLRILVTGATGMVGRSLVPFLTTQGHEVVPLGRRKVPGGLSWDDKFQISGLTPETRLDAVIHLAGENLAGGRWTEARKREILRSREESTRRLVEQVQALVEPPRVFLGASGIAIYGNDPEAEPAGENTPEEEGFLEDVVRCWEASALETWPKGEGFRVAHLRLGMVVDPRGGALAKMLPAFRLGVGGPIGNGKQRVPWVSIEDVVGLFSYLLREELLSGAFNAVAPECPMQREFARELGRAVRRPAIAPLPAFVVKMLFGEMGETLLLRGRAVRPERLLEAGYEFRQPTLAGALGALFGGGGEITHHEEHEGREEDEGGEGE